ncbi:hypothetical protein NA57DRAFT_77027 [Rhizodiscina lignyota]|uniref:Uncharacterized protein n=1 Tax=Rhizodiscina lignyota TaxID=1504668 RepID=A0A9P4IFA7_9PEZI|nr:hypothetical protein NA57DRAFT_77027 [Rhizodiscina lignyota]
MSRYHSWNVGLNVEGMRTKRSADGELEESDPKRSRSSEPCVAPTGSAFTPINAFSYSPLSSGAQAPNDTASHVNLDKSGSLGPAQGHGSPHRNQLVAEYLMLDVNVPDQSSRLETVFHESDRHFDDPNLTTNGAPKNSRSSRKAGTRQNKTRNSKKASSISDGLPIVKPTASRVSPDSGHDGKLVPTTASIATDSGFSEPSFKLSESTANKLRSFRYNGDQSNETRSDSIGRTNEAVDDRIQVLAPSTAVGSLKRSDGFGYTLYNGAPQTMDSLTFPLISSPLSMGTPKQEIILKGRSKKSSTTSRPSTRRKQSQTDRMGHEVLEDCKPAGHRRTSSLAQSPHLDTIHEVSDEDAHSTNAYPRQESRVKDATHSELQRKHQASDISQSGRVDRCGSAEDVFDLCDDDLSDTDFLDLLPSGPSGCSGTRLENNATPRVNGHAVAGLPAPLQSDSNPSSLLQGACERPSDDVLYEDDWVELSDLDETVLLDIIDADASINSHLEPKDHETAARIQLTERKGSSQTNISELTPSVNDTINHPIKPIVRAPLPKPIRDRSPIVGVTPSTLLRVCFRVGEALNVGAQAIREGNSVILELYARVISSYREAHTSKQHFMFADIWARRGPSIKGTYDIWKGSDLWDEDSKVFLDMHGEEKLCRCIARMKREDHEWRLAVLNIWQADWNDIEYVRGILTN